MSHLLLETWQIHDRINLYVLDAVDAGSLDNHSASKGRSVVNSSLTSTTFA
jgi:hypothetical protein